ncbi:MAG: pyrroline-5-carboxylate reductase [Candidatus Omnitrophica bacterium]|nr:pyrroline-5-carboxylate reductase [Candidatus Omnitrophota bacterium]MCM8793468.1 pyrroline-5-carboxylate reductase [Candidatus Omnitrophota bacterium]
MKVGIIGFGNMGSAIAQGINRRYPVVVFDKDLSKTQNLQRVKVASNVQNLVKDCEVIILAVKPQDFSELLEEIKDSSRNKLFISIAAGIDTAYLEKRLPQSRIVRVMPNLGIKVRRSVSCICGGKSAEIEDLKFTKRLFSRLGVVKEIDESLMNKVTALSGSGPGFIFYYLENRAILTPKLMRKIRKVLIEELRDAGESIGFDSEVANFLAKETVYISLLLLKKTKLSPQELRLKVASKGGTTEAGLKVLSAGGSWKEAMEAAVERAEELSLKD